jgi:hypothetical protein
MVSKRCSCNSVAEGTETLLRGSKVTKQSNSTGVVSVAPFLVVCYVFICTFLVLTSFLHESKSFERRQCEQKSQVRPQLTNFVYISDLRLSLNQKHFVQSERPFVYLNKFSC